MITGTEAKARFDLASLSTKEYKEMLYDIWHNAPSRYSKESVRLAKMLWHEIEDVYECTLVAYLLGDAIDKKD